MVEEAAKAASQAAGTLSQTTWGAILILVLFIAGLIIWSIRKDLKAEQASHQATRVEYMAFIKSKDQLAAGLMTIQDAQRTIAEGQQKQTSLLIDALSNQRRAG